MKGEIRTGATEYTVECGSVCAEIFIWHTYRKNMFIKEIRIAGWKIRNKQWVCPGCLAILEPKKK